MIESHAQATDPTLNAFLDVWQTLARFDDSAHDPSYADGYLVAIAASRRQIATEQWRSALTGDAFDRAFADPAAVSKALGALEGWLDLRRRELEPQRLLDKPDECFLTPLFDEWTDELRAEVAESRLASAAEVNQLQTGVLWAQGFLAAVDDFAADWPAPSATDHRADGEAYHAMMQLIECLVLSPDDEACKAFAARQWQGGPPTRDELLNEVCFAVQDLRVYWLDHGPRPEPRRVGDVPGRNDPCPCGSGKKFKKCHGQGA